MQCNNLIIGTGFAAHFVAAHLSSSETIFFQPHVENGEVLEINSTTNSIFEISQVQRTKNFGGGKEVWGGAISYPNDKNYFKQSENLCWNQIGEEIQRQNSPHIQDNSKKAIALFERIFPEITTRLELEQHGYATGNFGSLSTFGFPDCSPQNVIVGSIQSIHRSTSGKYLVRAVSSRGEAVTIEAKYLILASGNLLNACFVSLLSGQEKFPVGNHFSRKVADIFFKEPLDLKNIAQTYESSETSFFTLGNNGTLANFKGTENSFRLQVTERVSAQRATYELLFREFSTSSLGQKARSLLSIMQALFKRQRLITSATIRLMTDQPPKEKGNYFKIIGQNNGTWKGEINLELSPDVSQDATSLSEIILETASASNLISKLGLKLADSSPGGSVEFAWLDAGHYYGSIPVAQSSLHYASVDHNLELHGYENCFVVGSSSFPVGSHGHPTKLVIELASRLGAHLAAIGRR